jgi:Outer membrane protein beta-barrel domain
MKYLVATVLLLAAATLTVAKVVAGESNSVGVTVTSNRDEGDFSFPKNTQYQLSGDHTFANGLILGGSFQFTDTTFSDQNSQNLEATMGYRLPLNFGFSLIGTAGLGEHWRENPGVAFPYYVLRAAVDFTINQDITWNAISYRFRDAFDHSENYETPQIATGLTFKLDAQSSVSAKITRNWKDGQPSSTGVALGFKQKF